jgi:hypothetical protein
MRKDLLDAWYWSFSWEKSDWLVHERYKALTEAEQAFRTCKTAHLETRPIYVRTPDHTHGHVLVVMLTYLIRQELCRAWTALDATVEKGLPQLQTLCATEMTVDGGGSYLRIPEPSASAQALPKTLNIHLPDALPRAASPVVTRNRCQSAARPASGNRLPVLSCSIEMVNIRHMVLRTAP